MYIHDIDTPFVRIDTTRLVRNIVQMQARAARHGIALRPHAKTHKCTHIAALQLQHGACGLTTSRAEEALFFLQAGCPSVTVAYPLLSHKRIHTLAHTAREIGAELQFIADSIESVEALVSALPSSTRHNVFLKIDSGLHRCGLQEHDSAIETLARYIERTPQLRFAGLLSHAGHAYAAENRDAILRIAQEEHSLLVRLRERLQRSGLDVAVCTVGSTPTALTATDYTGITELRPGNYVFLDGNQVRLGVCSEHDIALSVTATVISRSDTYYIVDAGSKTLSSDLGAHGTVSVSHYGTVYPHEHFGSTEHAMSIVRLSEEHGFIRRNSVQLAPGDRVRIVPNHACPVANLAAHLYAAEGDTVSAIWHTGARSAH